MKTVCMCGSFKHYDEMLVLRDALLRSGASCEWPTIEQRRDPKAMTEEEAKAAILAHLQRMDRADLILIYNKDGYVGNSVVMEIGYAFARRKPLYALRPIQDPFLMGLVTAVLSPEDFIEVARARPGALRE